MPRTITKTVYTFKELIEAAKDRESDVTPRAVEKARTWLQQSATDHDWYEYVIEDWTELLESIGFNNVQISFSGFWSQGDGACFTADVDLPRLIGLVSMSDDLDALTIVLEGRAKFLPFDKKYAPLLEMTDWLSMSVVSIDSHYSHEHTCRLDEEFDALGRQAMERLWESFVIDVEQMRLDICRAIYSDLEAEHDFRTEDEQLIEDAEANDWMFDECGDMEIA